MWPANQRSGTWQWTWFNSYCVNSVVMHKYDSYSIWASFLKEECFYTIYIYIFFFYRTLRKAVHCFYPWNNVCRPRLSLCAATTSFTDQRLKVLLHERWNSGQQKVRAHHNHWGGLRPCSDLLLTSVLKTHLRSDHSDAHIQRERAYSLSTWGAVQSRLMSSVRHEEEGEDKEEDDAATEGQSGLHTDVVHCAVNYM